MSKFRRNTICSPRNRKKFSDEIGDISTNGKLKLNKGKLMSHGEFLNRIQKSLYYGKAKMSIPLSDYIAEKISDTHNGYSLNRLNYSTVGSLRSTPCSLILAMIYLDRLKDSEPAYTKHVTPTELFLVSMMVATKFYSGHDDEAPYVNWTEFANTTPDRLLEIELNFLSALDWKVYVSNEEFFNKVMSLEIILAQQQGIRRGFFTYLELTAVLPSIQIAKQFIQSILVLSLSYTVFVATMLASVFLVSQIPGTCLNTSSQTNTQIRLGIESDGNTIHATTPESIESLNDFSETNLNNLNNRLNEIYEPLNILDQPNDTWTPPLLTSWYSFLNPYWPVIAEDLELNYICDIDDKFFCNSTQLLSPTTQPGTESFRFDFGGIKIKWA